MIGRPVLWLVFISVIYLSGVSEQGPDGKPKIKFAFPNAAKHKKIINHAGKASVESQTAFSFHKYRSLCHCHSKRQKKAARNLMQQGLGANWFAN